MCILMCIMMMMDATSGVRKLRSISSMSGVLEPMHAPSCLCNMSAVRFLPGQNKPGRTHSWLPLASCVGSFWQCDGHCLECRDKVLLTTIALHGSFHEKETSIDRATLALDRCESQAKRPTLAIKNRNCRNM